MPSQNNNLPALTARQGAALVALVRQTLATRLKHRLSDSDREDLHKRLQDSAFQVHCGAFVTLKISGKLRGCIGSLTGREPLIDCVRKHAINAALRDPRFKPLSRHELERVSVSVSVLTVPQPMEYVDAEDLLAKLRPGVDGVTIRKQSASATFLPQVWEQLPVKENFLAQLCLKAGLPAGEWRKAQLEVETYQAQYFGEPD